MVTGIRLPASLHARLHAAAADRDVSANLLVTRAVRDYLDRLPDVDDVLPPTSTAPGAPGGGDDR